MLSLTDFYRIRESTLFNPATQTPLQHTTLNILTTSESSNDYLTRAEKHKHKLRSFDKKYPFHRLMTYENKKNFDPYSIVNEEDDALKEINILCKNAKIAAIRDKQLDERKYMENMYKKKEERLDFMMELERLKEIKFKEEKEKNLKKLNLDSQQVLIDQILDNERERLKKREQIEKDKHQMKMQLEKLEEEEKKRILKEKHIREQRVLDCLKADRYAILQKQKKKIEEKESELKDAKYNIEKAKREEEYIKEKKRIALQKEKEIQALREKQEKAQDKQAELDAIRAKRVYEETERKAKLKEKEDELLKAKKLRECIEENEKHIKIKEEMKANEIKKEKEEYERLAKERQREIEEEKERQRQKIKILMENGNVVKNQIVERQEKERKLINEKVEDKKKIIQEHDAYYQSVDMIKKQKIAELRAMNINEKYIVPVEKYNPIKSLRKQGM
jgi:hypothetical protein